MRPILPATLLALAVSTTPQAARADSFLSRLSISRLVSRVDLSKIDVGVMTGAHLFADDIELGVADDVDSAALKSFALLGARMSYALLPRLAIEGELDVIPTADTIRNDTAFVFGWRAHALAPIRTFGRVTPFVVAGVGALSIIAGGSGLTPRPTSDTDAVLHWGAGVKVELGPLFALRVDVRHLLVPNIGDTQASSDVEVHAGLTYHLGRRGRPTPVTPEPQAEQAVDLSESQPTSAPIAEVPPASGPTDTDGDGFDDANDKCVAEAEDKDGFEDDDGCPDLDDDHDGVSDATDKCPGEAETMNGVDDDDGCPEIDQDGDGLVGSQDKCPDVAEDSSNPAERDGCPRADRDGDQIADDMDRCPDQAETKNGFSDEDGCPDELPSDVKQMIRMARGVGFRKKEPTTLRADGRSVLFDVVDILKKNRTLRVEISAHTADEGDHDKNLELSRQRAEAVKTFLVEYGIAADRLTTVAYGPDKPIADNNTAKGREDNERIELRVVVE